MRILKFLNKINLITLLSFLIVHNSYSTEPVDIWQIDEVIKNKKNTSNIENIESENLSEDSIFQINSDKSEGIQISEEKKLFSKDVSIVGIYDPSENDLTMDMWVNSNGEKILEIINSLENIKLSNDATNILDIALLTNSYYPKRNISNEEFLKIKSDWLLKKKI